jgi:hypothetical protein
LQIRREYCMMEKMRKIKRERKRGKRENRLSES